MENKTCFTINTPETYWPERCYILEVIFRVWLGLEYEHRAWSENYIRITQQGNEEQSLLLPDVLFQTPAENWLTDKSMPVGPLPSMNPVVCNGGDQIPVMFGCDSPPQVNLESVWQKTHPYLWQARNDYFLGIDILGSAFFMLSRYEEYVKRECDQHDRFPASASLAFQEGFLDRPIINEYLEQMWQVMLWMWPGLKRSQRSYKTVLTHDVDIPFAQKSNSPYRLMVNCSGDMLKRRSVGLAWRRYQAWRGIKKGHYQSDLNYTFNRIMDFSEHHDLRDAFYFKTGHTNSYFDDAYSIDQPAIRQLMRDIHNRGHEIGLHPSYDTYLHPEQIKAEFHRLLRVCAEEGIHQDVWGGRQHFLRWQVPVTWRYWAEAGLNYDSTLAYADCAGFRCGTCFEFPVYDLERHELLPLTERPLIVMESSIFNEEYMGLNNSEALAYMKGLLNKCKKYRGDFVLIWHNNHLNTASLWSTYQSLIESSEEEHQDA